MGAPSCSTSCCSCNNPYFSCSNPYFSCSCSVSSCSSYFYSCNREACVLSLLKVTSLVVGLPVGSIGCLVLALGEVTFSNFLSLGTTSSFLLADYSIVIGIFKGDWDFPCLILMLFLVFKYNGPCCGFLLLGLTGVPNVANVEATSFLVFHGERFVCFPCFLVSWGLNASLGFSFSVHFTYSSPSLVLLLLSLFMFPPLLHFFLPYLQC